MPRRPRPAGRKAPTTALTSSRKSQPHATSVPSRSSSSKVKFVPPPDASDESTEDEIVEGSASENIEEDGHSGAEASDEEEIDVDAPRVAQWVDDDELEVASQVSSESEESGDEEDDLGEGSSRVNLKSLQDDLSSIPLGALRKAQNALAKAKALSDSEDESNDSERFEEASGPEEEDTRPDDKGKEKEKREIAKRSNKHAPTEMSSKRPVPRKKPDFAEKKPEPRDPRFLPITGEFTPQRFIKQYGFLSEMHVDEMKTLKENLKRARKLLANSPRDLRAEREQEVQRLERAVKRAESMVNKDRQEKVAQEALSKVAKEERERRKQGKGAWFMKESEKRKLVTKAKFEALAATGGKGAVKKAIDKKQTKVAQREKKRRPFAEERRSYSGGSAERPNKRQRFG